MMEKLIEKLAISHYRKHPGNAESFSLEKATAKSENILTGKRIIFLGSSVTYGTASFGESFVDFLEKEDGVLAIKEAVGGTTLVDEKRRGKDSYIARMKNIDKKIKADCFVCQLSTNDASLSKPLGKISEGIDPEEFDTLTVAGAIEYMIYFARKTWDCKILFYTGTKYESRIYEQMVSLLHEIAKKWDIEVLDLWNDEQMNAVSKEKYRLYMADGIHPSRAGYKEWWTPRFEEKLKEMFRV